MLYYLYFIVWLRAQKKKTRALFRKTDGGTSTPPSINRSYRGSLMRWCNKAYKMMPSMSDDHDLAQKATVHMIWQTLPKCTKSSWTWTPPKLYLHCTCWPYKAGWSSPFYILSVWAANCIIIARHGYSYQSDSLPTNTRFQQPPIC